MDRQSTLKHETSCVGVGLHSGRMAMLTMKPAAADTGIVFRRTDRDSAEIPAKARFISQINHATSLARDGVRVETVEHLLAALHALAVDNVIVELDGPEVPILDGSAAPFIYLIREAGIKRLRRQRSFLELTRPVRVVDGDRWIAAYPCDRLRLSYTIRFDHPMLQHQEYSLALDEASFVEEIAPARTFGFLKDVELMRRSGLARGGSLDNAVVLGDTDVLNNPLRFPDEFVRHKILDLLGDLVLLGSFLRAHVVATRAGHSLHASLVKAILREHERSEVVSGRTADLTSRGVATTVPVPAFARSSQ